MIKTGFSFNYNGERKYFDKSGVHKIDENLTVNCIRREFPEYNAADWVLWFENTGNEKTGIISDILDCDTEVTVTHTDIVRAGYCPKDDYPALVCLMGCVGFGVYNFDDEASAVEYKLHTEYFHPSYKNRYSYRNDTGRSSDGTTPFFKVVGKGKGAVIAIGWTGGWKADFFYDDNGNVSVKTGLQNKTNFYLEPGEKLRTSSILIMEFDKSDSLDSTNKFRHLIKNHFSHRACTKADRDGLMAFEMWGGLPSEEMKKRISKLREYDIKFEELWIDAGWYGQCKNCDSPYGGDWYQFAGEWEINRRVHPALLQDVKKEANDAGMNMMLWFEPERATGHVPIVKEHPEYFIPKNNGDYIVNYGNDKARNYIFEVLSKHISELGMSCYRQDFNTNLNILFANTDAEDRKGISEIKHICGMYKLWDDLHERFPNLLIDNCSSGGRRFDIETLRRSIAFFRSDYQCAFNSNGNVYQAHNSGIQNYMPYNGCTTKVKNDTYNARSSYSSSWGCACYNAIFQSMEHEDFLWLKHISDEYRRIRKYFSCDFYNHGSKVYDLTSWAVWQYHDEESSSGIVMAFRRDESPFDSIGISLKGIRSGAVIELENLNDGTFSSCTANADGKSDFDIVLQEKKSSIIYEYKIIR